MAQVEYHIYHSLQAIMVVTEMWHDRQMVDNVPSKLRACARLFDKRAQHFSTGVC